MTKHDAPAPTPEARPTWPNGEPRRFKVDGTMCFCGDSTSCKEFKCRCTCHEWNRAGAPETPSAPSCICEGEWPVKRAVYVRSGQTIKCSKHAPMDDGETVIPCPICGSTDPVACKGKPHADPTPYRQQQTLIAKGETPSALSAAPRADVIRLVAMLTFSNYTSAADYEAKLQQAIERVTPYFETYAATLREKLSTAERQYQSLVRCIDASDDDAQAVVKTLNERLTAAEAELARVTKLADKWMDEQAAYPKDNAGSAASAAVRLCAKELRAALRTGGEPK